MILDFIKNKIVVYIVALGLALLAIFWFGLGGASKVQPTQQPAEQAKVVDDSQARIVSINPENLDKIVIPPSQVIEINFNRVLVNDPGDIKIEPAIKFRAELMNSGKTLKIVPEEPYKAGSSYVITIKESYDLEGGGKLGKAFDITFRTVPYRGI